MLLFLFTLLLTSVYCSRGDNYDQDHFKRECHKDMSYKCGIALHQMVFPPTTCTMQYLERISRLLQIRAPLLFTHFANDVIDTFAKNHGVTVFITDAFGKNSPYPPPDSGSFTELPPSFSETNGVTVGNFWAMFTSTAQANVIGQGFMNNDGYTYYTFVVRSPLGRLLYVNVGAPTNNNVYC